MAGVSPCPDRVIVRGCAPPVPVGPDEGGPDLRRGGNGDDSDALTSVVASGMIRRLPGSSVGGSSLFGSRRNAGIAMREYGHRAVDQANPRSPGWLPTRLTISGTFRSPSSGGA